MRNFSRNERFCLRQIDAWQTMLEVALEFVSSDDLERLIQKLQGMADRATDPAFSDALDIALSIVMSKCGPRSLWPNGDAL